MWRRSYRNHVIMAFPSFDTATNSWAPQADISWCAGANRFSEFVRFQDRVMSENEAVHLAVRRSVRWINERLKQAQTDAQATANERDRSPPFKSGRRLRFGSQLRLPSPMSHKPGRAFSYNHFKALVAKLGVKESEPSLQKSYEALLKLREERPCSWTELKKRVERSRNMTARKSPARAAKKPRLPLTPRDWQRLI